MGYAFDNRYLFDANIRLDGASVFGSNKRYTETWSVGVAWNIHNENFLKNAEWMTLLKVRASIGNPGNQILMLINRILRILLIIGALITLEQVCW